MAYKMKCDKCSAKVGDVDRQGNKTTIISFIEKIGGPTKARCLKHLTTK